MKVEPTSDGGLQITVTKSEVKLLRTALERASFVDTDPADQEATFDFAQLLLGELGPA